MLTESHYYYYPRACSLRQDDEGEMLEQRREQISLYRMFDRPPSGCSLETSSRNRQAQDQVSLTSRLHQI